MAAQTIATGYVRTEHGEWYIQKPANNQWGFTLYDDDTSFEGGFGVDGDWELVPETEVPEEVKEELKWLLED